MIKYLVVLVLVGVIGCAGFQGKSKIKFVDHEGNPVVVEHEVKMSDKKDK